MKVEEDWRDSTFFKKAVPLIWNALGCLFLLISFATLIENTIALSPIAPIYFLLLGFGVFYSCGVYKKHLIKDEKQTG